jgi:phospholipase C
MSEQSPADPGVLGNIRHFVVLMLENRSFDHMLSAPPGRASTRRRCTPSFNG